MPKSMLRDRKMLRVLAIAGIGWLSAGIAGAQAVQGPAAPAPPAAKPLPPAKAAPAAKTGPAAKPPAAQPGASEAALRQRVDQLEEQLIDLQVTIGTLESLSRQPASAEAAAGASGDAARIEALELQLKSLGGQIQQLGEKVRGAGEPTRRSEAQLPLPAPAGPGPGPARGDARPPVESAQAPPEPPAPAPGTALPPIGTTQSVGSATVTSSRPGEQPQRPPPAASGPQLAATDAAAPVDEGQARHDYEVAYSYILQRDYGAAQAGFSDFIKRYPKDQQAASALYWLGESHYQQRNFADAAEAFDLVTALHATSPKAADSQLKRALSLSALGKNSEACSALTALNTKFQNAPAYVRQRGDAERRRLGCV